MHPVLTAALVAAISLAGCHDADDIPDFTIEVDVTSEVPLDRIDLLWGDPSGPLVPAPISPDRRARGELDVELAQVIASAAATRELEDELTATFTLSHAGGRPRFLAIGYQRDAGGIDRVVAAGESASGPLTVHLTAQSTVGLEVWGADRACARVADGPRYYVGTQDADCDGITAQLDCDDLDHCDLDAPTAAERAGCEVARCQPCMDRTVGACALGSRATCRERGPGLAPTVTCDSAVACGPATCLPEGTCGPAFTTCDQPWPDTDPRECLPFRWGDGLAGADVIPCALPAAPHGTETSGGFLCAGGSAVEIALPYADCTDVQVAIGDTLYETAAAVIIPPCTIRLTLTPTMDVFLLARGALVTFATADTSVSALLHLVAQPNTCGVTGACGAPPPASMCSRPAP